MRRGLFVLCIGVASLSLTSCSTEIECSVASEDTVSPATWNDVIDFTTGIYTNLQYNPWDGAYYEFSEERAYNDESYDKYYEYYYMNEIDGNPVASGEESKISKTESTEQEKTSSYYVADDLIYIRELNKVTGDKASSDTNYVLSNDFAEGNVAYTYSIVMRYFESSIKNYISRYTMTNQNYYTNYGEYTIAATKSTYSISWTICIDYDTYVVTIKTDSNYFINYFSLEHINESSNVKYSSTTIYKESKEVIEKPSWVNDTNFPPKE